VLLTPTHPYTQMLRDAVPGRGAFRKAADAAAPILEIRGLQKRFVTRQGLFAKPREVVAARDVSCHLAPGDTLAVVGESGSGKSTLARILLRLVEADAGEILWRGGSVRGMKGNELRNFRRKVQIVFQDPYSSLDPRLKVGESICRGPMAFGASRAEARRLAEQWLERVGLGPKAFDRFPHEFSGGQRQRICIARALALQPEVLIADEAVSALDVSIQAQILDLLNDLKAEMGLAMIFITHDLRVAREIADRVLVMRHGRIEEERPTEELFEDPRSDYTKRLLDAVPGRAFFAARAAPRVPA
jgi:ABC-type glutathione transport system ATPase component